MLSTPKSKGELFLASSLRDGLEDNDIRQVKTLLLSKEADPNVLIPTHGISPFHLVIGNDSEKFAEEVTKLFLRHGGNPNVRSHDGMTPVHVAAAWGRVGVLELLLANGGDPLCLDDDGRSPFHYAFDGNFYNAVTILGKYCGMSRDEEEEEQPKYKLTLDKILINKGNVVAEYVPSEDSYSVSTKSEWSERFDDVVNEAKSKAKRPEFGKILINKGHVVAEYVSSEDFPSIPARSEWIERFDDVVNETKFEAKQKDFDKALLNKGNALAKYVSTEDSYSISKSESRERFDSIVTKTKSKTNLADSENPCSTASPVADEFSYLNTNNITLRRYQKSRTASPAVPNLDAAFVGSSVAEEKLLIGEIISRLSDSCANDSLIAKDTLITNGKPSVNDVRKNTTQIKKSYLPPPRYRSHNATCNESPRRRLVDTSIISKSPNLRIAINEKTPTPSKKKTFVPQSYTCKSRYWNSAKKTPPLRSTKTEARIKSASSTPKRKQYSSRLYEVRKSPAIIEKTNAAPSRIDKNITPTILDRTYSKDRFGIITYSPEPEVQARVVNRKFLARNIAVNLDDRMYDDNQDSGKRCDSQTNSKKLESAANTVTRKLKPPRIYNKVKPEVASVTRNPKSCNVATSEFKASSPRGLPGEEKVDNISRPPTPKARVIDYASKAEINFRADAEGRKPAISDSPGSSCPISASSLISKTNFDGDDKEDTKIWLEIEEVCRNRCVTPPASVSMTVADDSPSSSHTSQTTFYSDYGSEESYCSDFNEGSVNDNTVLPNKRMMTSISHSESFVSVEEEYTYEDAEEGVAFIERHLCVIPASVRDDLHLVKTERSLVDQFDDLSIAPSDRTSVSSQSEPLSRSMFDEQILRERLTALGEQPGPITDTTFNVYLKRLWRLERERKKTSKKPIESPKETQEHIDRVVLSSAIPDFLLPTDWTSKLQFYQSLEEQAFKEYATANPTRKYRGGISKTSFCYLLLDPRVTRDLPRSSSQLSVDDRWKRFLEGVFYVGQGKAARPAHHLYDAFGVWSKRKNADNINRKIRRILDIWKEGKGIVCLHIFSHTMVEEACSREASMIDALETTHLTNCNRGTYYGYTTTMTVQEKRSLGKYLLYKAMEIFMHEGERQLFPRNVIM